MAGKHTAGPWRVKTTGNIGNMVEGFSGKPLFDGDDGYRCVLGAFDTPARRLKFPYSFGDEAIETALAAIARATQPLPPPNEE